MWKILVVFIIFAVTALFFIFKAGDKIDMQGEAVGANPTEIQERSNAATTLKENVS